MFAATTIADEILDLKRQRHAIVLAHHYQEPEIQELADVIEKGKGKMPKYGASMKPDEIKDMVAYIRTLGKS